MGYAQWTFYTQGRWKKELLNFAGGDNKYNGNGDGVGGAVYQYGGPRLENDRVSERWRWGDGGGAVRESR